MGKGNAALRAKGAVTYRSFAIQKKRPVKMFRFLIDHRGEFMR
jgi:hypothetical protein